MVNKVPHPFSNASTGLRILIALTLLVGILYPAAVLAIGQVTKDKADGSIIRDSAGEPVGSALLGQSFDGDEYFQSRPSAAGETGYDGLSSGASNLAADSTVLAADIAERKAEISARESVPPESIPADALTASASGLDPDISIEYARLQVPRVAEANGLSVEVVRSAVAEQTLTPVWGFIGEERVNVLRLNLAVQELAGAGR